MVVHAIGAVTGSPVLFAALTGGPLAAARTAAGVLAGAAESLAPVPPPQEVLAYTTDPTAVTATQVSEATTRVLETPTYRQAAQRIAAEIAAAPHPPPSVRGSGHSRVTCEVASSGSASVRLPSVLRRVRDAC